MKYRIAPIDPIISRDARSFGAGSPMHTLKWLSPTLIAGAVRTKLWKENENLNDRKLLDALLDVKVSGAFPIVNEKIYFPRPFDIIVSSKKDGGFNVWKIRPMNNFPENSGANMPLKGLMPSVPDTEDDFKPEKLSDFWNTELFIRWLKDEKPFTFEDNNKCKLSANVNKSNDGKDIFEDDTFSAPQHDERVHVYINPKTGASLEGKLFSTTGLDFISKDNKTLKQQEISIDINDENSPLAHKNFEKFITPLGGERRLAEFSKHDSDKKLWDYPKELSQEFSVGNKIRVILATPAMFDKGWYPDWLDVNNDTITGKIPNTDVTVKLISAVTERWQPVSGWNYSGQKGPKPMRRAVPAGSVYFFEIIDGKLNPADIWLKSICCNKQDINDGFGLVLVGKW